MEIPIKMDDLGVPLFLETSIYSYHTFSHLAFEVGMERTDREGPILAS